MGLVAGNSYKLRKLLALSASCTSYVETAQGGSNVFIHIAAINSCNPNFI